MEAESTNPPSQFDLVAWLAENFKAVLIAVVVVVAIGAGIGLYSWNKERSAIKANEQVFAKPSIGLAKTTASADTYLKAAQDNSGNAVGDRAEVLAASVLFQQGKFSEAQAQFEKASKSSDNGIQAEAALGVAASLDAQGKAADATAKYLDVVNKYATSAAASQARLSLARLYEAQNKPEEAFKYYEQLDKSPNPYDPWRAVAVDKRQQLLTAHPELAKLEAPAPGEQIIEVTTPPAGSTNAPIIKTNSVK